MEAVEDAGFDGRLLGRGGDTGAVTFHVDGMICSSCSGKIEAALLAQPGVTHAAVNLLTHKAEVRQSPHFPADLAHSSTCRSHTQDHVHASSRRALKSPCEQVKCCGPMVMHLRHAGWLSCMTEALSVAPWWRDPFVGPMVQAATRQRASFVQSSAHVAGIQFVRLPCQALAC